MTYGRVWPCGEVSIIVTKNPNDNPVTMRYLKVQNRNTLKSLPITLTSSLAEVYCNAIVHNSQRDVNTLT